MDITKYCIQEDASLTEALRCLDKAAGQPLFVLREGKLVASITDGDIRRHILQTGNVAVRIKEVANYSPRFVTPGTERWAMERLVKENIKAIPVVDDDMCILRIIFRERPPVQYEKAVSFPVVMNAGGKGTRLHPYTKILPKPLIPVGDIPISEMIINRFRKLGCDRFYMIVNYKKNMIKAYYNEQEKMDFSLKFIDEDAPLGTGGGLSLLKGMLDETFLFINCDTVIEADFCKMLETHKENGNLITMITALKRFDIPYGIVETGENGSIQAFREKPQLSYLVNTGCYVVEPQVIDVLIPGETVGFPTVAERLFHAGKPVGIYPIGEESWFDMGQFDTMEDMRGRLNLDE